MVCSVPLVSHNAQVQNADSTSARTAMHISCAASPGGGGDEPPDPNSLKQMFDQMARRGRGWETPGSVFPSSRKKMKIGGWALRDEDFELVRRRSEVAEGRRNSVVAGVMEGRWKSAVALARTWVDREMELAGSSFAERVAVAGVMQQVTETAVVHGRDAAGVAAAVAAAAAEERDAAAAVAGRAGEATTASYPATVHGAYLSGERVAREIIKSTNHTESIDSEPGSDR